MLKNLLKKSTLGVASLLLVFVLFSCDKVHDTVGNSDFSDYYSSVYSVEEPSTNTTDLFVEANENVEFGLMPLPTDRDLGESDKRPDDRNLKPDRDIRNPFAKIFRAMQLTEAQREQVREFMIAFKRCQHESIRALREAQRPIIEAANVERRAIMEQVKSGDLTREQAKAMIRAINERVREELMNNEAVIAAHQALRACWETLLANIESILTEEQLVKWERFLDMKRK